MNRFNIGTLVGETSKRFVAQRRAERGCSPTSLCEGRSWNFTDWLRHNFCLARHNILNREIKTRVLFSDDILNTEINASRQTHLDKRIYFIVAEIAGFETNISINL